MEDSHSQNTKARVASLTIKSGVHRLAGQIYRPKGTPTAIAVLNGALGVPAQFYDAFATWLAEEKGVACLTYDYRDFGASATGAIKRSNATLVDWGVTDAQSARDFAAALYPDLPLWVIGHSLGAICLPFQARLDQIDRVIAIGSGATHVSDHPWPFQGMARLFWSMPMRLISAALGYMPGRVLGLGADLPKGVFAQWRRWCTNEGFMSVDIGRALPLPNASSLSAPVKFIAMSDDPVVPAPAVWRLMHMFGERMRSQLVLKPEDFGLNAIGHIPVFAKSRAAVWDAVVA